ncbi:hypothetical protein EDB92DRAFT_191914 [Lactarius akahatsu]|uniref:Uncharacterized protein n=1 Tax=Lactarius akahatsu TaxID=416441 RepID=A0AAD4L7F6_9AGAM|nr:hypothetical protein EDB92DRAFT_191914 [Lactarius akahatsu]
MSYIPAQPERADSTKLLDRGRIRHERCTALPVGSQYDDILFAFHSYGTRCFPDSAVCTRPVTLSNTVGANHSHLTLRFHHDRDLLASQQLPPSLLFGTPPTPRSWNPGHLHQFRLAVPQRNQEDIIPSSFPIQSLPHAFAQASAAEPDRVYPLWPVLIMIT